MRIRPHFSGLLLLVTAFCVRTTPALAAEQTDQLAARPNIVLCMGDDHGWDETGYNGHPHLRTPVLDEMAAQGLRLDHFYSAHPSCSPTRGSVITGRHPNRYGTFVPNCSIRPEEIGIAKLLRKAGYACGHFGKWHLGPVKKSSPTNPAAMGFDTWLSHDNFFELHPTLSRNGAPPEQIRGESSEIIVNEALRYIGRAAAKQQPFFVVIWFGSPHEPYSGLPRDLALYDNLPESYAKREFQLTSNETGRPVRRSLRDVLRERYAEITAMDRAMGQLREGLSKAGARDNTLLWYCGDNGTPGDGIVTSPFRGQKGNLYEGGIRVPGVIEWPAVIKEPRVSKLNTVTSDMLPTLCELTGQPLPNRPLDGVSLKPLLEGDMSERAKPICFWSFDTSREAQNVPYIAEELQRGTTPLVKLMSGVPTRNFRNFHHPRVVPADYGGTRVILTGKHKLIVSGSDPEPSRVELFDLQHDAAEKHDVHDKLTDITNQLRRELRDWQTSVLNSLTGADYR